MKPTNYFAGLALAVAFLFAANAQAELVRTIQPENLVQIFAFTVNKENWGIRFAPPNFSLFLWVSSGIRGAGHFP